MEKRNNAMIHVLVDELNRELVKRDSCTRDIEIITNELRELGVDTQGFPLPEAVADQITNPDLTDLDMEDKTHE